MLLNLDPGHLLRRHKDPALLCDLFRLLSFRTYLVGISGPHLGLNHICRREDLVLPCNLAIISYGISGPHSWFRPYHCHEDPALPCKSLTQLFYVPV